MADKLDLHRNSYGNYENETEPEISLIKRMANILGVTYIDIIDGYGAPAPTVESEEDYDITITVSKTIAEKSLVSLNEIAKVFSLSLVEEKNLQRLGIQQKESVGKSGNRSGGKKGKQKGNGSGGGK